MSIQDFFDKCEDSCTPSGYTYFNWDAEGIGFGQLSFYIENDKLMCGNELMGKDFIKEMLCKMVDDCELDCPRSIPEMKNEEEPQIGK